MRNIIGIDTGVTTGIAVWDVDAQQLVEVTSSGIVKAMALVGVYEPVLIRIEDARLRKWYNDKHKQQRAMLQGVGSVKRDAAIWQEFCIENGYDYELVPPSANRTKTTATDFARLTGWLRSTNEHARDAAGLVYGFTARNLDTALKIRRAA